MTQLIHSIPTPDVKAPKAINDSLTSDGAHLMAVRLADYWRKLGFRFVRFWTETTPIVPNGVNTVSVVRSNLVNGVPPRSLR